MTIGGVHTVGELRDWVHELDQQIATMADTSVQLAPTWSARDGAGFQAWIGDFKAFQARYAPARATAQGKLDAWSLLPESVDGAEEEWQGVERALRPSGTGSARGEFQELGNRLQAASSARIVYTYDQPTAGDFDLGTYQTADTAIRNTRAAAAEAVGDAASAAAAVPLWVKVVAGGTLALLTVTALRR